MIGQNQLPVGAVVSFDLYPAQLYGTTVKNAKVLGVFDAYTARTWIDTLAVHSMVFPTLPAGVADRHDAYQYLRVLLPSGDTAVFGLPWIKPETLKVRETRAIKLTLADMRQEDYNRLVKTISACGWRIENIDWVD